VVRLLARAWKGLTASHQRRLVARSLLEIFVLLVLFLTVIFPVHVVMQLVIYSLYGFGTFALGVHWAKVAADCGDKSKQQ